MDRHAEKKEYSFQYSEYALSPVQGGAHVRAGDFVFQNIHANA